LNEEIAVACRSTASTGQLLDFPVLSVQ